MTELIFNKITDTLYKVWEPFDDAEPILVGLLVSCSGDWHFEPAQRQWKLNKEDMFCIAEYLHSLDLHGK